MFNEEYLCHVVQSDNSFKIFDLDYNFIIDLVALKNDYHALQKRIHPDLYSHSQPDMIETVSLTSAKINQAYEELIDPLKRGRLLLKLLDTKQILSEVTEYPNELLLEQMEIHELIESSYQAKDISGLNELKNDLQAKQDRLIHQLVELFAQQALPTINMKLNELAIYQKLYLTIRSRVATLLNLE